MEFHIHFRLTVWVTRRGRTSVTFAESLVSAGADSDSSDRPRTAREYPSWLTATDHTRYYQQPFVSPANPKGAPLPCGRGHVTLITLYRTITDQCLLIVHS